MTAVFACAEFWRPAQCADIRAAIDRGALTAAEIYNGGYRVDEGVRRTFEADVDGAVVRGVEDALARVRPRVSAFFGIPLAASEGPGFLRYPIGGFYAAHRDCLPGEDAQFPRRIAVVVFVSECEGGALRVYGPPAGDEGGDAVDIAPAPGLLVAFPATWLHEVLPVTSGVRDTIVDWFY